MYRSIGYLEDTYEANTTTRGHASSNEEEEDAQVFEKLKNTTVLEVLFRFNLYEATQRYVNTFQLPQTKKSSVMSRTSNFLQLRNAVPTPLRASNFPISKDVIECVEYSSL